MKNSDTGAPWIAVVTARFNSNITERLEAACLRELEAQGWPAARIRRERVPGAFELPLAADWLLASGAQGVIALGAVVRGETDHYDYVCSAAEKGLTQVQLKWSRPAVFGVLTTDDEAQAMDRAGGAHGNKGADCAQVLLEMLKLKQTLQRSPT